MQQISCFQQSSSFYNGKNLEQEGHDGPVSLLWLIRKIPSYQTFQYLGISLKHNTPTTGLKLVAVVLMFSNKKISLYKPM